MKYLKRFIIEVVQVFKDTDIILLLLVGPIFLTLLFGGAYVNTYLNDIPLAVLDEDNSSLSRMIVQQFQENERFQLKYFVSSKEELEEKIESRKVSMGVYIPVNFSNDVMAMRSTEALVIVDGANQVVGNNAYAAASGVIQTVAASVSIKMIQVKGLAPQVAKNMGLVFNFNDRTLYDPRMTYMNYMLLGYIAVFLQQVILSGVGISVAKAGKDIAAGQTWRKLFLRIAACSTFALTSTSIAVGIAATVFKVPIRGSVFTALLLCLAFILSISCPAILLGAILKDKLKFAQIAYTLSLPSFIASGYIWPQDQIPPILNTVVKILWPLSNFARPFDEVLFKGVSLTVVSGNILQMLVYTLFWMPLAVYVLKRRHLSRKSEKSEEALAV